MLSSEFVFLVMIANALALPLAWYLAVLWLRRYAFHMVLNPSIFVITATIALVITLAAVSFQTIRASRANPVASLRYE